METGETGLLVKMKSEFGVNHCNGNNVIHGLINQEGTDYSLKGGKQ